MTTVPIGREDLLCYIWLHTWILMEYNIRTVLNLDIFLPPPISSASAPLQKCRACNKSDLQLLDDLNIPTSWILRSILVFTCQWRSLSSSKKVITTNTFWEQLVFCILGRSLDFFCVRGEEREMWDTESQTFFEQKLLLRKLKLVTQL